MRSLLIVGANDEPALVAALASEADAVVVALDIGEASDAACAVAARIVGEVRRSGSAPAVMARVGALGGGETERDLDIAMAFSPAAILLPCCVGARDVQALSVKLAVREARLGLADGATGIVAMIDTAEAALAAPGLRGASARLIGIAWDAAALGADVGASAIRDEKGRYAGAPRLTRELTLMAAAAAGVPAMDTAYTGPEPMLRAEARVSRRDGFAAKLTSDPAQIAIINEVFAATREL